MSRKIDLNILKEKIENQNIKIDSIYVQQNDKLEKLLINNCKLHELRSVSKLLIALAVGIAIEEKRQITNEILSVDTKIYLSIKNEFECKELKNIDNIEKIKTWTIRDMLLHISGYEKQMMSEKDIIGIDEDELLEYVLSYDIPYPQKERYSYNNAEPFIISVFFQEAFGINIKDYINDRIFKPLSIMNFKWDNYGEYCPGGTGLYLNHEDFHKIGMLLLNNGRYDNKQIISESWIKEVCSIQIKTPSEYKAERVLPKLGAGYYTFISRDGYIFRDGANGQYIIVNKQKDLLITILSLEKDMKKVTEIFRDMI